jgi:hypothetical protein
MQNAKLEVMAIDDDASVLWERMKREAFGTRFS